MRIQKWCVVVVTVSTPCRAIVCVVKLSIQGKVALIQHVQPPWSTSLLCLQQSTASCTDQLISTGRRVNLGQQVCVWWW